MVLRVLKFGTQKLFEEERKSEKQARQGYEIDQEALGELLDRKKQFSGLEGEGNET